ncbi:hypothetical protein JKP88DRAFT_180171 [Tribonema minus]|uniref:Uncharacterized protein n=1 Tax=Tribonema minus TaxID=303371 RepID=A0A835Z8W6_9STRA|nr:hypothetical protein JKP88DRAFT_180171 [Tribonema minus]
MATGLSRSSDFALLSAAELDVLVTRIEQLEAAHAALQAAPYRIEYDYESQSLLEALGDQVKRFVVTRLTPRTDRECAFSFARWRCEPRCACRAQYKLGDYWPSRMCRRVKPEDRDPDCAPDEPDPSDEPVLRRVGRALRRWAGAANAAYRQHLAAPSDADCAFDLARLRCTPSERCAYQFRWWDVTPSQSCRLRLDGGGGGSGAAAAAGAGGGGGSAGGRGQWQGDGEGWRGRDPRGDDEGYREL